MVEDEISSRSGVLPLNNRTVSEFREFVNNFSSEFSQMDWHYYVIQILYLVEYADYDSQAKLGYDSNNPLIDLPTEVIYSDEYFDFGYSIIIKNYYWRSSGYRSISADGYFYNADTPTGLWVSFATLDSGNHGYFDGVRFIKHQVSD